ncbi:phage portal protein [Rhizobium sp. BK491]|uniref:phage portal protein n=1 Tax=Rhizobium sp. BK491 TaxID=2587009 RepID=UPI001837D437|nr:HK97 family phage portal protein [Rhizobium sp. BK491]
MKLFNRIFSRRDTSPKSEAYDLTDPRVIDYLFYGSQSAAGEPVTVATAMRNPALFRAFMLISNAIGMLPLQLIEENTKQKATDHPLYRLLHREPNNWQSAYDFKAYLQMQALATGDGYALIVESTDIRRGGKKISRLIPVDSSTMRPVQNADFSVSYVYTPKKGVQQTLSSSQVFHLRGPSLDGICGLSLIRQARDAIGLALATERASGRMFKNGTFAGGALSHKGKLSDPAYERLKASLAEKEGPENAGKNLILEEGMEYKAISSSARDSQLIEIRRMQVEEIARVTGVPRPLLMVDETSWGTGIEALGQFFVAYALNPWFEAWQQAIERCLLFGADKDRYAAKFNAAALLRGSLKDQADFLAKALGSGGSQPWMHVDEVRDVMDLPKREDPPNPMMGHNGGPPLDSGDKNAKAA